MPESPRYLVSKDRDDEAHAILIKYHGEGDENSEMARVEMAQIKTTIKLEMENSKQSWVSLLATSGMRRRVFISIFIGLFTQMSGNTLLSYYSNILFQMMGYTSSFAKSRLNIANQVWSFVNASVIAVFVTRFRRRVMFQLSAASMMIVFLAMTVSFAKIKEAQDAGVQNKAAGIAALFWYYAYSATYNIGNNSLTYSKSQVPSSVASCRRTTVWTQSLTENSLPGGALALRGAFPWYWCRANLCQARRILFDLCQPARYGLYRLEVHGCLHGLAWL